VFGAGLRTPRARRASPDPADSPTEGLPSATRKLEVTFCDFKNAGRFRIFLCPAQARWFKVTNCDLRRSPLATRWHPVGTPNDRRLEITVCDLHSTVRPSEDMMAEGHSLIPTERIEKAILLIRGHKVMLDKDLADLYGVPTGVLNQAVKRNRDRSQRLHVQLTREEADRLRSQFVILKTDSRRGLASATPSKRGQHLKYLPYAFTEQGVAMLSSVLRSDRAVLVNIEIMRAFVRLRRLLASHADLARKLEALEKKYDAQFRVVFDAIRQLMTPPADTKRGKIGFRREHDK
jgi:ORF6N domain-containing protein